MSLLSFLVLLAGCVSAPNTPESAYHKHKSQGAGAEAIGNWQMAEEEYYQAAEYVRKGYLGPNYEADAAFNLGRAARVLGKINESESLLKRALELDERVTGPEGLQVGYTLFELAITYSHAKKYEDGVPLLDRLEFMLGQYSGRPRATMKEVYQAYSEELLHRGLAEKAQRYKAIAALL